MYKSRVIIVSILFLVVGVLGLWYSEHFVFERSFTDLNEFEAENETEQPRPDRPDLAAQEELLLRSEIGKPFSYPAGWRFKALARVQNDYQLQAVNSTLHWEERGPSDIGGRVRVVVVHPQHPFTWWVGSVGGGIWFTEDGGLNWVCQTDDMPVISVSTIAICDSQPNILYAGTGEGFFNYDAIVGDGIFKTTNGGAQWVQLPATVGSYDFRYINRIVVHPQHADTVLAATKTGVLRSFDGGQTWEKVFESEKNVQQIVCNPQNFNTLLITVWRTGIFKSTDLGNNWQFVSEEISKPTRIELAYARQDTNLVYAAAADTTYGLLGLFKSADGGQSWQNLGNSPNWLQNQGWYDNMLLVHPFDEQQVFVGGVDLYQINTQNDTITAQRLSTWYYSSTLPYVHADQHCLAAIPQTDSTFALVVTNDGGVFYSPDAGKTWEKRNTGLNITQFYDADRNPKVDMYIGGTQDNGTLITPNKNPTKTTKWETRIGGDGFDCAWHDQNPEIVYATLYSSKIYKSANGGDNFGTCTTGLPESRIFHTPLVMDPHNNEKLFTAGDSNRIYITWNGASQWHPFEVDLGNYRWIRIAVSEKDSNIVWAATSSFYINVSQDGGRTFTKVPNPDPNLNAYLTGIATSPFDSATALVMFGVYGYGKIFRTTDLGQTWQDITNNLPEVPVHCAVYMPYDSSQIWIGTDIGVFVSYNNGQSWKFLGKNLPAVAVRRMKIVGEQIVAATHGRGVWTLNNDTLRTYNLPVKEPWLAELPLPNPNTDSLKIRFTPRGAYDSLQVVVNETPVTTFYQFVAYADTFYTYQIPQPGQYQIQIKGFFKDSIYASVMRSVEKNEAVDSLYLNFDDGSAPFSGDFVVSLDEGFSSNTLHTGHPYQNNMEHIALLKMPVRVSDSLRLMYSDIAVVEPGDPGFYYPYPQMWDYVTVEGSADGENWEILITPYDARFHSEWLAAFNEKRAPNVEAFVWHDTTLSSMYTPGTKIYLRFRLHADAATNGWGWAIDQLAISKDKPTGLSDFNRVPFRFALLGNYPNPFNNRTQIRFTLSEKTNVRLVVYNALGQKVCTVLNNKVLSPGTVHKVIWNGTNEQGVPVGSGVYFYRLQSANHLAMGKMLLLK